MSAISDRRRSSRLVCIYTGYILDIIQHMNRYFFDIHIFHYNFYCKNINKCIARILITIAIRIVRRIKCAQHNLEMTIDAWRTWHISRSKQSIAS